MWRGCALFRIISLSDSTGPAMLRSSENAGSMKLKPSAFLYWNTDVKPSSLGKEPSDMPAAPESARTMRAATGVESCQRCSACVRPVLFCLERFDDGAGSSASLPSAISRQAPQHLFVVGLSLEQFCLHSRGHVSNLRAHQ